MNAYKILIRYVSTFQRDFYEFYKVASETDPTEEVEYETTKIEELNETLEMLDKKYGYENLRAVVDATYDVDVIVNPGSYQFVTSQDINDIYQTAYNEVFTGEESDA